MQKRKFKNKDAALDFINRITSVWRIYGGKLFIYVDNSSGEIKISYEISNL